MNQLAIYNGINTKLCCQALVLKNDQNNHFIIYKSNPGGLENKGGPCFWKKDEWGLLL